jgi:hypothetical protein
MPPAWETSASLAQARQDFVVRACGRGPHRQEQGEQGIALLPCEFLGGDFLIRPGGQIKQLYQIWHDLKEREKEEESCDVEDADGEPGSETLALASILFHGFRRLLIHLRRRLGWTSLKVNCYREGRQAPWLERGTLTA